MRVSDEKAAEIEARAVLPGYGLQQATDVGLLLIDLRAARTALARICSGDGKNDGEIATKIAVAYFKR